MNEKIINNNNNVYDLYYMWIHMFILVLILKCTSNRQSYSIKVFYYFRKL